MLRNIPSHLPIDLHLVQGILTAIKSYPKAQPLQFYDQQRVRAEIDRFLQKIEAGAEPFEYVKLDVIYQTQQIDSPAGCLVGAVMLAGRIKDVTFDVGSAVGESYRPQKPEKPGIRVSAYQKAQISDQFSSLKHSLRYLQEMRAAFSPDIGQLVHVFEQFDRAVTAQFEQQAKKIKQLKKKESDSSTISGELMQMKQNYQEIAYKHAEKERENERLAAQNYLLRQQLEETSMRLKAQEQYQQSFMTNTTDSMQQAKQYQAYIFELQKELVRAKAADEYRAGHVYMYLQREALLEQSANYAKEQLLQRELQIKTLTGEVQLQREQTEKLKELLEYYQNKERLNQLEQPDVERTQYLNSLSSKYRSISEAEDDSMDDSMTCVKPKQSIDELILHKIDAISQEKQQNEKYRVKIQVMQTELTSLREYNSNLKTKLDRAQTSENLMNQQNERIIVLEIENKELKHQNADLEDRCKKQENKILKQNAELDVLRRFVK